MINPICTRFQKKLGTVRKAFKLTFFGSNVLQTKPGGLTPEAAAACEFIYRYFLYVGRMIGAPLLLSNTNTYFLIIWYAGGLIGGTVQYRRELGTTVNIERKVNLVLATLELTK